MNDRDYERMLAEYDSPQQDTVRRNRLNPYIVQSPQSHLESEKLDRKTIEFSQNHLDIGHSQLGVTKQKENHINEKLKMNQTDTSQQMHLMSEPKELANGAINRSWKNLLDEIDEENKIEVQRKKPEVGSDFPTRLYAKNDPNDYQDSHGNKNGYSPAERKVTKALLFEDEPFLITKKSGFPNSISPEGERKFNVPSTKAAQSSKADNLIKVQLKDPYPALLEKSSKKAQSQFLEKGKHEQNKRRLKNSSFQSRGIYRHYILTRKKREREEDLEIYER